MSNDVVSNTSVKESSPKKLTSKNETKTSTELVIDVSDNYLRPGNLVLVCFSGYPWWPCFVYHDHATPKLLLQGKNKGTQIPVIFMGKKRELSLVSPSQTKPFDETMKNVWRSKKPGKISSQTREDYEFAWQECEQKDFDFYLNAVSQESEPEAVSEADESDEGTESSEKSTRKAQPGKKARDNSSQSSKAAKRRKVEPPLDDSQQESKRIMEQRSKYDSKLKEQSQKSDMSNSGGAKKLHKVNDLKDAKTPTDVLIFLRFRLQKFLQAESKSNELFMEADKYLKEAEKFKEKMTPDMLNTSKIGKVAKRIAVMSLPEDKFDITMRCLLLCRKWAREAFPEKFQSEDKA